MNTLPRPGRVDVGLCEVAAIADADGVADTLSGPERQRWQSIHSADGRRQYLASRWLLRSLVGQCLEQPACEVALAETQGEPPYLRDNGLRLGLSHSSDLCLCITAAAAVGCDVEHQRPRRYLQRTARQFFHAREAEQLERLSSHAAATVFHRLWTLKEAGHKALAQGLTQGLARPAFTLSPALACWTGPDSSPWWFAAGDLPAHGQAYSLALAVRACDVAIRAHRYWPTSDGGYEREAFDPGWSFAAVNLDDRGNMY